LSLYPVADEKYLLETAHNYGVSINGKVRARIELSLDLAEDEVKRQVLELENVKKWTNGATPKKFIFVKGKIINVVV
jgi:leucyl-tRNA synthetase